MRTLYMILTDTAIFSFRVQQFHFIITAGQLISWGIALMVTILTQIFIGRRMALGILGVFIAALVGVWLASSVIVIDIPGDIVIYDIPLLKAFLGALVLEVFWYIMTYSSYRTWIRRTKATVPNTR